MKSESQIALNTMIISAIAAHLVPCCSPSKYEGDIAQVVHCPAGPCRFSLWMDEGIGLMYIEQDRDKYI